MGIFKEEHEIFRASVKKFIAREVIPNIEEWEENGELPRSFVKKCAEQGYIGRYLDEKYGGLEVGFEYSVILIEELQKERLMIVIWAQALAEAMLQMGIDICQEQRCLWAAYSNFSA